MFAGAAVWALRSLGYTARLASGFYADPRRYEARSDHTPVMAADVHFWIEVNAGLGHWMTLDPTPGYAVLSPPRAIVDRMLQCVIAIATAVGRHPWIALAACGVLVMLVMQRARIADAIDEVAWRLRRRGTGREAIVRRLGVFERRAARVGMPRPRHLTPSRWLAEVAQRLSAAAPASGAFSSEGKAFVMLADQALYLPGESPVVSGRHVDDACRTAGEIWSWEHFTALAAEGRERHKGRRDERHWHRKKTA